MTVGRSHIAMTAWVAPPPRTPTSIAIQSPGRRSGRNAAGRRMRITNMRISFKPLHRHFAAEVQGFDMRQPIDAATARDFEDAIDRHGILVFPAQLVTTRSSLRSPRISDRRTSAERRR